MASIFDHCFFSGSESANACCSNDGVDSDTGEDRANPLGDVNGGDTEVRKISRSEVEPCVHTLFDSTYGGTPTPYVSRAVRRVRGSAGFSRFRFRQAHVGMYAVDFTSLTNPHQRCRVSHNRPAYMCVAACACVVNRVGALRRLRPTPLTFPTVWHGAKGVPQMHSHQVMCSTHL